MTGGPELRPGPTEGAVPGRPPGGKPGRAGENPPTEFDALLTRMAPQAGAAPAAGGDPRPLGRIVAADPRVATPGRLAAASLDAVEAEAAAAVVALDAQVTGQSLAQGLAERIVAVLEAGQAKGAQGAALAEGTSESAVGRRAGALAASVAMAAALARRADADGALGRTTSPAATVTHRETAFAVPSFGKMLGGAGATRSSGAGFAPSEGPAGSQGSSIGVDMGAGRQGRAEQLMLGAGAGRGPALAAKTPELATTLVRAAADEPMRGAGPQAAGGEAASGPAFDGLALGLPGAADGRPSGAAPPAGAPAAQAAAAAPTMPVVPGAVKVLHIQLHPAELGVLEVRMRMTDGVLEMRIEASRPETVALLKNDRETLESVLRGAGHSLEAVTVSLAEKSGDASGQPSREGWQGPASGAEAQAGSPREQGSRFDDRPASRPNGPANEEVHDDQNQSAVAVRPRGGLYL